MTTEKIYDNEPYSTDFTAQVMSVDGDKVILDRTLFFPEEGGQTCDRGYDLSLNSSRLGMDESVKILTNYIDTRMKLSK